MNSSKDFDFFDNDDDEEFFNVHNTKESSCPHESVFATGLEKKMSNQGNLSVSNKLTNFLCKFNFQPKDDVGDDTAAKLIVKDCEKDEVAEAISEDLKKTDSQHLSQDSSYFKPKVNSVKKSIPLINSVILSQEKRDLITPMDEMSFDVFFDDCDADSFLNEPCETDIETKQSNGICKNSPLTLRHLSSTPVVPHETVFTDEDINFKSKSALVENLIECTSTPNTAVTVKKSQFLKNGDLPFDKKTDISGLPFSKSHVVNNLFSTKELLSSNSHKSRKRKFPGPAGLLPDLPPESPVPFKPYEHMLKLDILDSSYEQDFCSQTDTDEFLLLPWRTMISDVSNHIDISLLQHFNVKSIQKQASKKKLPKYVEVPILCVLLKSITCKDSEVVAVFKDETGELLGKIYHEVMEEYKELLKPGSVIVLKKVVYLLNQLSVKAPNIVRIYDSNGSIAHVNSWNNMDLVSSKKLPVNANRNITKDFNKNVGVQGKEISEKENFSLKAVCIQEKENRDYSVDIMDETLFTDDFDELILSMDDQSFLT